MKYKDSLCVNADGSPVDLTPQVGDLVERSTRERVLMSEVLFRGIVEGYFQEFVPSNLVLVSREGCKPKEIIAGRVVTPQEIGQYLKDSCKPKESRLTEAELVELLDRVSCGATDPERAFEAIRDHNSAPHPSTVGLRNREIIIETLQARIEELEAPQPLPSDEDFMNWWQTRMPQLQAVDVAPVRDFIVYLRTKAQGGE